MGNFKELNVWKDSVLLAKNVYSLTKEGPFARDFGLKDQITRSAVSIPSNIAEGESRGSNRDAIRFLHIAKASTAEFIT